MDGYTSNSTATVVVYDLSRPAADFRRNPGSSPTERFGFGVFACCPTSRSNPRGAGLPSSVSHRTMGTAPGTRVIGPHGNSGVGLFLLVESEGGL